MGFVDAVSLVGELKAGRYFNIFDVFARRMVVLDIQKLFRSQRDSVHREGECAGSSGHVESCSFIPEFQIQATQGRRRGFQR